MDPKIVLNGTELFSVPIDTKLSELIEKVEKETKLNSKEFYLTQNGKIINSEVSDFHLKANYIRLSLRLCGGKGGFGSMLRAIGAQIEKTTNREACRDLSGRRLRDINEEKRLKSWLEKQKDKDVEAEERRKRKLEKLLRLPKHEFKDSQYEAARSELTEKVSDAVEEGFKKADLIQENSVNLKRKATTTTDNGMPKVKKPTLWIDDELSDSSSDDDSSSDSEGESSKTSKTESSGTSSTVKSTNNLKDGSDSISSEESGEENSKISSEKSLDDENSNTKEDSHEEKGK